MGEGRGGGGGGQFLTHYQLSTHYSTPNQLERSYWQHTTTKFTNRRPKTLRSSSQQFGQLPCQRQSKWIPHSLSTLDRSTIMLSSLNTTVLLLLLFLNQFWLHSVSLCTPNACACSFPAQKFLGFVFFQPPRNCKLQLESTPIVEGIRTEAF